ncbi:hypothetical protein IW139_004987, partial [Coemansia sp. RSA 353]
DAESGVDLVAGQVISAKEAEDVLQKVERYIKNSADITAIEEIYLSRKAHIAVEPILGYFYKEHKSESAELPTMQKLR